MSLKNERLTSAAAETAYEVAAAGRLSEQDQDDETPAPKLQEQVVLDTLRSMTPFCSAPGAIAPHPHFNIVENRPLSAACGCGGVGVRSIRSGSDGAAGACGADMLRHQPWFAFSLVVRALSAAR